MHNRFRNRKVSLLLIFALLVSNFSSVFALQVNAEGHVITVSEAIETNSGTATVRGDIIGVTAR